MDRKVQILNERSPEATYAAGKYRGAIAANYDAKREDSPKWHAENRIVRDFLFDLPPKTIVLDLPTGTGRFLPLYHDLDLTVLACDINEDMLAEARKKRDAAHMLNVSFHKMDILRNGLASQSVDVALNIRLFNWLSPPDVCNALVEMQRICRRRVIFNVRVANHSRVRGYDLINAALWIWANNAPENRPWKIARDEEILENYRMIMLEPT